VDFLKFENEVMSRILHDEDPTPDKKLVEQYKIAKVTDRKFTGRGFFTDYEIPDGKYRLDDDSLNTTLGNIGANINDLKYGVGFVVFIKNGLISCLEGYTYGEEWLGEIDSYEFFY
jgi:hypothetical protein